MLVFLRLSGSAWILGCAPRKSCLLLKPANITNRYRESILGHLSLGPPLIALFSANIGIFAFPELLRTQLVRKSFCALERFVLKTRSLSLNPFVPRGHGQVR
jgi:hypothetical protein